MMNLQELETAKKYRAISEPHIARAIGSQVVPWLGWTGPSVFQSRFGLDLPIFVLHLDPQRINAGRLVRDRDVVHNLKTALRGEVEVTPVNSVGFGYVFDPRGADALPDLVELTKNDCLFVTGPRRTGKTTFFQHLMEESSKAGYEIEIIDPKPYEPGKWLNHQAVGQGMKWEQVAAAVDRLSAEMANRTARSPRKRVFFDELFMISEYLPDYPRKIMRILAFGGEGNMDVVVASQSEELEPNGLKSMSSLRAGFVWVRTSKIRGIYRATVDFGDGKQIEARVRGPFGAGTDSANIILTPAEIELVRYAMTVEPVGSFALSSKMNNCNLSGWTEWGIRAKANEWFVLGLLTQESNKSPRMVSERLAELAGLKGGV